MANLRTATSFEQISPDLGLHGQFVPQTAMDETLSIFGVTENIFGVAQKQISTDGVVKL
jgi:hypothetical protein